MSIEKGLVGKEDINFGLDTFNRKSSAGTPISITKVNASHLPITDSAGKFVGTEVETALAECQVENAIGSNSKDYTNKSGAERVLGDVVIVDTSADDSFTTTTTEGHTSVLGVVGETIANNASGKVVTGGYINTITVDAATSRGSFLRTATTEGKATPETSFTAGCFAIAMSTSAGPGSVSAIIFGSLGGSFLPLSGGVMTGMIKGAKGADVASGSTLTLGTDGNYFDITGTTTITGIATVGVGTTVCLQFDGAVTLTHHATDLVLPGAVDLTTSAGTHVWLNEYATGKWRVLGWLDPTPTGTGNQVLSVTPTLTTPKMDTINEETSTNGVTIDGVKLKDSYIEATNNTSGVKEGSIDWANAGGLQQGIILNNEELSHTGVINWTKVGTDVAQIYIPANANSLEYIALLNRDSPAGASTIYCRIGIGATDSTEVTSTSTSYTWSAVGTINVSALSGWQAVDVDLKTDVVGNTVFVKRIFYRII